jgi:hypothetical protein
MLHSHSFKSSSSQVTVKFGDGVHSFHLAEGATLTELAASIRQLGRLHSDAPISIDIQFSAPRAGPVCQAHQCHSLTH